VAGQLLAVEVDGQETAGGHRRVQVVEGTGQRGVVEERGQAEEDHPDRAAAPARHEPAQQGRVDRGDVGRVAEAVAGPVAAGQDAPPEADGDRVVVLPAEPEVDHAGGARPVGLLHRHRPPSPDARPA
jgi:hypothetical protein